MKMPVKSPIALNEQDIINSTYMSAKRALRKVQKPRYSREILNMARSISICRRSASRGFCQAVLKKSVAYCVLFSCQ